MNIAEFCIKNNRTSLTLYVLLMLTGISTFFTIGRLENPDFTIRVAQIITQYPGRTSLQVEQEVTHPLETKIREMPEIKEVNSTSKNGLSIISAEVHNTYDDLHPIWQKLRNRVAEAELPEGTREPQVNDEFGDVFGMVIALTGDGYTYRELEDWAESIRDDLLLVDDVAKVEIFGSQEEQIFIEFSNTRLAQYGFSPYQIAQLLQAQNAIESSGSVRVGPERATIRTLGEFTSLEDLGNTTLQAPGQSTSIRLSDIGTIRRGYKEPQRNAAHFNGDSCLVLSVSMKAGGVITELGEQVSDRLQSLRARLPWGLDLEFMIYQPEYVDKSISDFLMNLGQAFFFVVLVMFLFAGLRIALVVGILVPSAILMSLTLMPSVHVELQQISIAALIIALGMLVDNAVVVSEQTLVRLGEGDSPMDAAVGTVRALWIPLLAASLTTIFAFLPIATAKSDVGEFCYSLFAVVALTLLSSWVLSTTIIPMFCYAFLRPLKRETFAGRGLNRFQPHYTRFLTYCLNRGARFPLVILGLTILAGWGFRFVDQNFFPPNERAQFTIDFEQPFGTDIATTVERVSQLEDFLYHDLGDAIVNVSTFIGSGGPRWYLSLNPEPPNPNYAFLSVITRSSDPDEVSDLVAQTRAKLDAEFPDARGNVKLLENGPPVGAPIQIRLLGPDLETVYRLRDRIVAEIGTVAGIFDVRDDWGAWGKQITVEPDLIRAGKQGLTAKDIAGSLGMHFSGMRVTDYREGEEAIPILLQSREDYRTDASRLKSLNVYSSSTGASVPLAQVADVDMDWLPSSILRRDTVRVMTIKAEVTGRFATDALADIQPRLETLMASPDWEPGYAVEYGGEFESSEEANESIMAGMPFAMMLLMLVLISQFNSYRKLLIIVVTIPPMIVGITPGLIITRAPFGFMAMLGMISLMGIIVNNAILLLDQIELDRESGMTIREAILHAAQSRLRPILMTTLTTIVGLMPLSVAGGEMWRPMANTMMFGLGFATVLTLVLCPVMYGLLHRERAA